MLVTEQDAVMKKWCSIAVWRARPSRSPGSDGYALHGAGPLPIFRHGLGSGRSMPRHAAVVAAESTQLSRSSASKIIGSRAGNDGPSTTYARYEPRQHALRIW
jgi:hypothetical protein